MLITTKNFKKTYHVLPQLESILNGKELPDAVALVQVAPNTVPVDMRVISPFGIFEKILNEKGL